MRTATWLALACSILLSGPAAADPEADAAAIHRAVLNYANSVYDVRPELVDASVHPKLQKIGYYSQDGKPYRELWMNFYELRELAASWNKEGRMDSATARREVKILDQLDRTAVVRLDAEWGIDFFHLAKKEDGWKIMNVIWQSHPPGDSACRSNEECAEGEHCLRPTGECEGSGSCQIRPEICTMDYTPVCGCDGQSYSNACGAASAGVSVAGEGACE